MLIAELLASPHQFVGREVSLDGTLLVGADSRLVVDDDKPDEGCVLLPHEQVKQRLIRIVPPWGGGRYAYWEDASVTGQLADEPLRFVKISAITVRRDRFGVVYEITRFSTLSDCEPPTAHDCG